MQSSKKLKQWQIIEKLMLTGKRLTVLEASKELNITCLRSRVSTMRKRNIPIESHRIDWEEGYCYEYFLPNDYIQLHKDKYHE